MTMPKPVIARIVKNRAQSVLSLATRRLLYQTLEFTSAVFEIFELVEPCAGGRQQHGIALVGARASLGDGRFQRAARDQRRCAAQLALDFSGGGANQKRR